MKTTHADFLPPLLAALSLALSGCLSENADLDLHRLDGLLASLAGECAANEQINTNETPATPSEDPPDAAADAAPAADGVAFSLLRWAWGGFDGSKAALSDKARIKALKVTASGLSCAWESGGCEDLGASSKTDASCLACLFCFDGSSWRGGKFDWISTSRISRDLENIESGYNGWDAAAFRSAKAHAFCIVSKDGRRRTNVIVQEGGLK